MAKVRESESESNLTVYSEFRMRQTVAVGVVFIFESSVFQVSLKEQGRLLRQNEFLVWQGRGKKCLRHVFLFEELILFSKARRFPDRKVSTLLSHVSAM